MTRTCDGEVIRKRFSERSCATNTCCALHRGTGRYVEEMPNARLVWVEECGHVPHLEQPDETAAAIVDFVKNGNPMKVCTTAVAKAKTVVIP